MIGEQHYSVVFQALPMPCLILLPNAPEFTIVNVSDAYSEISNTNRHDLIGKGFFEVFPNNPYQSDTIWRNIFNEVIQKKKPCKVAPQKYAFPTADVPARLDVKYLEVVNTPVLDAEGEIEFIIRSMTDVTDIIYHERFLEDTQHAARIGSWEVNMARQTVTWSVGLRKIYEVDHDYHPTLDLSASFYPDPKAREEFKNAFQKVMEDGTVFHLTLPMVTAKNHERWLYIVGKADLVDGTCIRVYGISQDITETKRLADLDHLERNILELNTQRTTSLKAILADYLLGVEALFPGIYCSIHRVQDGHLLNWVAPSLPDTYISSIHNRPIGSEAGSCGTAAYSKKRVIVDDISKDRRWTDYKHLALAHDLKACWSHPIMDSAGEVLAVLGMYYKQVKTPNQEELVIIDRTSALLKIIIENHHNADLAQEAIALMAQGQELARFGNWQRDLETNQTTWSAIMCDIYGINPMTYRPSFEHYLALVHPDDRERVMHIVKQIHQTGNDAVFEERIVRPDGEIRHVHSWARLLTNGDNVPIKLIGACLDITETKQAELTLKNLHAELEKHLKEVEESEKKYSDLFHLSPQPMWVYDLETYRYLDVNAAAIIHYGYTREEFMSMTIKDIRPPSEIQKMEAAVALSRQHDKLFSKGIYKHRKKNGEIIHVEVRSNIIKSHGRKAEIILAQDITEKLYYIEAIEAQNKKLQEIAWMQSHMVRAPLARIMGLVDLIQHVPESGIENSELLDAINSSAIELDDILRSITAKAEQINLT